MTALRLGPPASGAAVATALARSLLPPEDSHPEPAWLLPEQRSSFRRLLAAIRTYRGALLADPVGSGKTYVALAVAGAFNHGNPTACLVPAALLPQWEAAGTSVGIRLVLKSHEQVSRGGLPEGTRGVVIVDESHHFRNCHTKRYGNLAAWLLGRPTLLVTATPIVNRLSDLGHQLHLAVRDNALANDGIVSLRANLAGGGGHPALGQLIVENRAVDRGCPRRVPSLSTPTPSECKEAIRLAEALALLRLSRNRSIAGLVRSVLLRAAGSSPAAFAGALRRYRRLLLNARDATNAGRAMDRSELRRFTAELGDQLMWWELLPQTEAASELELSDLADLDQLILRAEAGRNADPKLFRLAELIGDEKPTIVFTASRDTVRYIREALRQCHLAWCTGDRAGIGPTTVPRQAALAWFRAGGTDGSSRHLVVTDVAAEGLDLQCAARVVHYDLPWTPMRLEQREGRAVRLGSQHSEVEVVRFAPPPTLEQALQLEATLARKTGLPAAAGLGAEGRHIWRWRTDLADRFSHGEAASGVATLCSPESGLLAGFSFYRSQSPTGGIGASVGWLDSDGRWIEASETITERLTRAAMQNEAVQARGELLRHGLGLLAPVIRDRLALVRGRRWAPPDPAPAARGLAARIDRLIQNAARRRQAGRLLRLERALGFVAGGHTAGEELLIARLAETPDQELEEALSRLPAAPIESDEIEVRLNGLILFTANGSLSPS